MGDDEKKGIQNGLYNPVLSVTMMNIVTTEPITSFSDKNLIILFTRHNEKRKNRSGYKS